MRGRVSCDSRLYDAAYLELAVPRMPHAVSGNRGMERPWDCLSWRSIERPNAPSITFAPERQSAGSVRDLERATSCQLRTARRFFGDFSEDGSRAHGVRIVFEEPAKRFIEASRTEVNGLSLTRSLTDRRAIQFVSLTRL